MMPTWRIFVPPLRFPRDHQALECGRIHLPLDNMSPLAHGSSRCMPFSYTTAAVSHCWSVWFSWPRFRFSWLLKGSRVFQRQLQPPSIATFKSLSLHLTSNTGRLSISAPLAACGYSHYFLGSKKVGACRELSPFIFLDFSLLRDGGLELWPCVCVMERARHNGAWWGVNGVRWQTGVWNRGLRNRGKALKGDEHGVAVVMETGLYGNSLLFFFFFFKPDRGWSADCVSVSGVCGYETSEKNNNNNKQAHISILRVNMNMSIPTCSTV